MVKMWFNPGLILTWVVIIRSETDIFRVRLGKKRLMECNHKIAKVVVLSDPIKNVFGAMSHVLLNFMSLRLQIQCQPR